MDLFELRELCVALVGLDVACQILSEESACPIPADRLVRNRIGDMVGAYMRDGIAQVRVRGPRIEARVPGQQWPVTIFDSGDLTSEAEQLAEWAS